MKNVDFIIIIFLVISLILFGFGIFVSFNKPISDDEILDELDDYFIDKDGEIVIGEINIPDDITESDVLNEIDDYLLDTDGEIDIGNMSESFEQ